MKGREPSKVIGYIRNSRLARFNIETTTKLLYYGVVVQGFGGQIPNTPDALKRMQRMAKHPEYDKTRSYLRVYTVVTMTHELSIDIPKQDILSVELWNEEEAKREAEAESLERMGR